MDPRILTTLFTNQPLTKTFYRDAPSEPYPLVSNFTSQQVQYTSITELAETLKLIGDAGGCLLKGHLTREVVNESRAGLTDPTAETNLLVIDYDSDGGFESITELLEEIDPLLAQTDFVFQHSASSGITGKSGLRGHIFFMLTNPVPPVLIKLWLKKVNLVVDKFKARIKLSRNAVALCYALDITVNQNDKLIYIAPPKCVGFTDPLESRFSIHTNNQRTYTFNATVSMESNKSLENSLIAELQDIGGITRTLPKYKSVGTMEVLTNPGQCVVTGTKDCGKYTRINLNGGDSFAYWYHNENPEILHNFKGEPEVYLKDIAPSYYASLMIRKENEHLRPFVFRDLALNLFFNAEFDPNTQKLHYLFRTDRNNLADFMIQRGAPAPRIVPDWDVFFDPTVESTVDFTNRRLNLYRPSEYISNPVKGAFPTIEKTLRHICVDEPTYEHFVKWLAHIVQFKVKTQTSWVFQGHTGTGKGTLFHQILTPIFGADHCQIIGQKTLEEQYNEYLRRNIILWIDEADASSSKQVEQVMDKLKTLITEPIVPIRRMRTDPFQAPSFSNVIFATNKPLPALIAANDRRYNVAPRQTMPIVYEEGEYQKIKEELSFFVEHLNTLAITKTGALKILNSSARQEMIQLSKTGADLFFEALQAGDLDFFAEALRDSPPLMDEGYQGFNRVVTEWMKHANSPYEVFNEDLVTVYKYIGGRDKDNMTLKKFGHLAGRHNLQGVQRRVKGMKRTFYPVHFKGDFTEWLEEKTMKPKIQVVINNKEAKK